MNLSKKKSLAVSTLGVGKDRIVFNVNRLDEIKEAITKQDIRDLLSAGAIFVKDISGRKTIVRRRTRRRMGSIKHKKKPGKRGYMILTRKLRAYLFELRNQNKLSPEIYSTLRKEIRAHIFKSKAHIKERIAHLQKWKYQEEED